VDLTGVRGRDAKGTTKVTVNRSTETPHLRTTNGFSGNVVRARSMPMTSGFASRGIMFNRGMGGMGMGMGGLGFGGGFGRHSGPQSQAAASTAAARSIGRAAACCALARTLATCRHEVSRRGQGLSPLGRRRQRLRVVPAGEVH